jgi:hypothetical protein
VVLLVGLHVLLVRRNGVVPPFELDEKLKELRNGAPSADGPAVSAKEAQP